MSPNKRSETTYEAGRCLNIASTKLGQGDLNSKLKVKTYDGSEKEVDAAAVDSNYLISMIGVLLKFRLKPIPLSADIEKCTTRY